MDIITNWQNDISSDINSAPSASVFSISRHSPSVHHTGIYIPNTLFKTNAHYLGHMEPIYDDDDMY